MEKKILYEIKNIKLPIIPMRGIWVFPHTVIHFDVGREKSLNALNDALLNDSIVFLCAQIDPLTEDPTVNDYYKTGVVAEIKQTLKLPNGNMRVLVEGVSRAKVNSLDRKSVV